MLLGAAFLTDNALALWQALTAQDLRTTITLLGEALFMNVQGAAGGMIGAAVGFLVGFAVDAIGSREDCPPSCDIPNIEGRFSG